MSGSMGLTGLQGYTGAIDPETGLPMGAMVPGQYPGQVPGQLPGVGAAMPYSTQNTQVNLGLPQAAPAPSPLAAAPPPPPAQLPGMGDPSSLAPQAPQAAPSAPPAPASSAPSPPKASPSAPQPNGADTGGNFDGPLTQAQLDEHYRLMVAGEGNGSADQVNPVTGATGKTQFMPATETAFLASSAGQGYTRDDFKTNKDDVQRKANDWLAQGDAAMVQSAGFPVNQTVLSTTHAVGGPSTIKMLGDPDGDATATLGAQAVKNNPAWGIKPGDTNFTAVQKIGGYYSTRGGASGDPSDDDALSAPDQFAGTGRVGPAPSAPPPSPPSSLPGFNPATYDPTQLPGYHKIDDTDKLLAFAGGAFSGKTAGESLGLGIKDYQATQQAANDQLIQGQEAMAKLTQARAQIGLTQANTQAVGSKIDLGYQKLGLGYDQLGQKTQQQSDALDLKARQGDAALDARTQQAQAQIGVQQARLAVQNDRTQGYLKNLDFVNSGAKAMNTGMEAGQAKQNMQVQTQLVADQGQAQGDLQRISDLQAVLQKDGGVTGNTFRQGVAKFLADKFGIQTGAGDDQLNVTQDGFSLGSKLVSDLNNSQSIGAKAFGGRITQGQSSALSKGTLNLGTSPGAAQALLDTYAQVAQKKLDISKNFTALTQDPAAYSAVARSPGGFGTWLQQQEGAQYVARGGRVKPRGHGGHAGA